MYSTNAPNKLWVPEMYGKDFMSLGLSPSYSNFPMYVTPLPFSTVFPIYRILYSINIGSISNIKSPIFVCAQI